MVLIILILALLYGFFHLVRLYAGHSLFLKKNSFGVPVRKLPRYSSEQKQALRAAQKKAREHFLDHAELGLYQCVIIFLVASVAGLILETIWMYLTQGLLESRAGLVWGPFSPIYGEGAVIMTLLCWQLRKHHAKNWMIFLVCAAVGGALEQLTGWSMVVFTNSQSWTYLGLPDAITQWVAWRFLFAWGAIGLLWYHIALPSILWHLGAKTTKRKAIVAVLLVIFILGDWGLTVSVLARKNARDQGIAATSIFDEWIDRHYGDNFVKKRFANLKVGEDLAPNS